ncbi:MAG: hypothetical protein C0475_06625 [Planctomyces sp.]|nr:hypothetical protein [Planctomyces sp.]
MQEQVRGQAAPPGRGRLRQRQEGRPRAPAHARRPAPRPAHRAAPRQERLARHPVGLTRPCRGARRRTIRATHGGTRLHFDLIDAVLHASPTEIVTLKQVTAAEEYLGDHFPGFPVLPGVMMLEAMVQAARRLIQPPGAAPDGPPLVLGAVRALKYGRFVRPGQALRVRVGIEPRPGPSAGPAVGGAGVVGGVVYECRGQAEVIDPAAPAPPGGGPVALGLGVSGRFTLRPARLRR